MKNTKKAFFLFILFAVIAILVNLFLQWLVFSFVGSVYAIYYALIVGTLGGLFLKYVLDKKFVFQHVSSSAKQECKNFFLYAFIGGLITLFYCVIEIAFYYFFTFPFAHYVGAFIGLTLGYSMKFYFDKNFIFKKDRK